MPEPTQIQKREFLEISNTLVKHPNDMDAEAVNSMVKYLDNFMQDATEGECGISIVRRTRSPKPITEG